jgi:DNA-binding transcriptional ArsR family regulator
MSPMPKDLNRNIRSNAHFRVAVALYELADASGLVKSSTKDLTVITGVSESTLTRAFRDLEKHGYLITTRTRKGFNKFAFNEYRVLLEPKDEPVESNWGLIGDSKANLASLNLSVEVTAPEVFVSLTDEQSTAVTGNSKTVVTKDLNQNKEILRISNQSERKRKLKKSDTDRIFNASKKNSKGWAFSPDPKDFNTRILRPIASWSHWDVAAEFADRLHARYPDRPALINKTRLAKALLPIRSEYNSTPELELTLIDWFFEDNYKVGLAERNPEKVLGTFLNMFKTNMDKARSAVAYAARYVDVPDWVYASDGKRFDNSMPGRFALKEYEEELAASIN